MAAGRGIELCIGEIGAFYFGEFEMHLKNTIAVLFFFLSLPSCMYQEFLRRCTGCNTIFYRHLSRFFRDDSPAYYLPVIWLPEPPQNMSGITVNYSVLPGACAATSLTWYTVSLCYKYVLLSTLRNLLVCCLPFYCMHDLYGE